MKQTIIIADDHPLFRAALHTALQQGLTDPEIHEAGSIAALQNLLEQIPSPDLILLDLHMPGAQGFSGLIYLKGHHPSVPVIIVSAAEEPQIMHKALQHGASGFIPKSAPMKMLSEGILEVFNGKTCFPEGISEQTNSSGTSELEDKLASLTPQQFRVLGMITEGLLNKQIAYELAVSEATIKAHVTAIFKKLGVRSRTQAVIAMKELTISTPGTEPDNNDSSA